MSEKGIEKKKERKDSRVQLPVGGFAMAVADSVPGVSGSTVAFILGFYDGFIRSLDEFFGRNAAERRRAFRFLCRLGIGWVIGMAGCVLLFSRLFEQQIYFMSSLFLGLTVAAIPYIIREEKASIAGKWKDLPFVFLGAGIVILITMARSAGSVSLNFGAVQPPQIFYLVLIGVAAISAMVLPGISGSTVLLIGGAYLPAIKSLRQIMQGDFSVLPGVIALGTGILAGIVLSTHFIRRALDRHRGAVVYLILGLMAGSLYSIAMGPTSLVNPLPALSPSNFDLPGFLLGILIVFFLNWLGREKKEKERKGRKQEQPAA